MEENRVCKRIMEKRSAIMGVAVIMVTLFHSSIVIVNPFLRFLKDIGYAGVDIFVLISGMSMYYSYRLNCKCNYKLFMRKRLRRVLPPFAIFFVISKIYEFIVEYQYNWQLLAKDMRQFVFWQDLVTYRWFVPFIIAMYIVTPLIDKALHKGGKRALILLVLFTVFISIALWGKSTLLMGVIRIIPYAIGYYIGYSDYKLSYKNNNIDFWIRVLTIVLCCSILGIFFCLFDDVTLADYGLYWYPTIILCISLIDVVSNCINGNGNKVLVFLGKYSLEIYLWHYFILCMFGGTAENSEYPRVVTNVVAIVVTIFVACVSDKFIKLMRQ